MPEKIVKIIAGLGNPGKEYALTRHNAGFCVLDLMALEFDTIIKKKNFDCKYLKTKHKDQKVFFVKPQSFMNKSGFALYRFASFYKIPLEDIIVIHDDIDLEFAEIQIVKSRGHGGHNGIRSIIDAFGRKDFIRVRIGVGSPEFKDDTADYVLSQFNTDELKKFEKCINKAFDACLYILENGVMAAMNRYNTKT